MPHCILGFSGLLASGKGTSAAYIEKTYHAKSYRFSTMLRDVLSRVYIEQSRDNLVRISELLRENFGEDLLAKTMAKDVDNDTTNIVVVDGIRRMADITYLQKIPGFVLVEIFADPQIRYNRLITRSENIDDQKKTYEEFLQDHERSTEVSILDVVTQATEHINNNGDLESLYTQLDTLVNTYASKH